MKKINNEKIQHLSFDELYNIYKFLENEAYHSEGDDKRVLIERMNAVKDEMWRVINNLF